jgi:hypothetical protein
MRSGITSEHKPITVNRNSEYEGTYEQSEYHLVSAKFFHLNTNFLIFAPWPGVAFSYAVASVLA